MRAVLTHTDDLLRGAGAFAPGEAALPTARVLTLVFAFGIAYGALMGTFQFHWPDRLLQVLYSAVKVPLLLLATGAICLPGFFVLNTVLGLRDDFAVALRAILTGQAGVSIVLASMAPLTRFFYYSSDRYRAALLFNLAVFGIATLAGQWVIIRQYRPLVRKNHQHRLALLAWLALYGFVGIQMAWMCRPLVGAPGLPTTFFRQEPFTNAYVMLAGLIFGR